MSDKFSMSNVDIVIPDLLLPQEIAADACAGLYLPVLEKMLARAEPVPLSTDDDSAGSLEAWLCRTFGVVRDKDDPIAPITMFADGIKPGSDYWLRADPVYLQIRRTQLFLHPHIPLDAEEAAQLCTSLNTHFAVEGLQFFSPHPQRWYLRMENAPDIVTRPLAQVAGKDVQSCLPGGQDALYWHKVFNEIQMIFFEHPVNQARDVRGDLPVNSIWLWGGGRAVEQLVRPYTKVYGDSFLAGAFAQAAKIPCRILPGDLTGCFDNNEGGVLIVWEGLRFSIQQGNLQAWRDSIQVLEQRYIAPLWEMLHRGRINQLGLNIFDTEGAMQRFVLTRGAKWKLWRLPKTLVRYTLKQ